MLIESIPILSVLVVLAKVKVREDRLLSMV
jgi:hypothetical protein